MGGATKRAATLVRPGGAVEQAAPASADGRTQWQVFRDSFCENRAALVSVFVMGALVAFCVVAPFVIRWSPTELDYQTLSSTPPSARHLLGTDAIGRDVLARLASAGRISLLVGLMVALFSAGLGAAVGISAGYFGGKTDARLMWVVNVLMTIPSLPLMIALSSVTASATHGPALLIAKVPVQWQIIFIMSVLGWMPISRVVRSQVISLRRQEFVEAATALGSTHQRIMLVHILPNCISVLAVFTTLAVSTAILSESALSFLGLGIRPPTASWGNMLNDAHDVFTAVNYWWLAIFPALMILITVLCVNFIGDGLRDAFDPKSKR